MIRANAARAIRYIHIDFQTVDLRPLEALQDDSLGSRLDILHTLMEWVEVGLEQYGVFDITPLVTALQTRIDASNTSAEEVHLSHKILSLLASEKTYPSVD